MTRGSRGRTLSWLISLCALCALGACSFGAPPVGSGGATDASVPVPDTETPVTCGDLTCDAHATCLESPARCVCAQGYDGDGFACTDVDECATANGGCPAACANNEGGFTCYAPRTCEEVKAMVPGWTGGTAVLYVGGDATKPWTAHCTADDREYLPLTQTNYATYAANGGGQDVRTTFTRIRIDPVMLLVDIADQTYSTSTGMLNHQGTAVTSMPYAVAMDCRGPNSTDGRARIDLGDTPFVVDDQFEVTGAAARGNVTTTDNGRTVDVTGGGNCGWHAPVGTPYNPFNTIAPSPILQLAHRP